MIKASLIVRSPTRSLHGILQVLPIFAFLFVGCDRADQAKAPDRPVPADEVVDFNALYSQNCAGCHGANGMLGPAPPINDPLFLGIVPDAVLMKLVIEGRPGTPMPGFSRKKGGSLTDAQVKVLATGIKPRWKSSTPIPTDVPPYSISEKSSSGNVENGRQVFLKACAGCHGADGEGTDKAGRIHDVAFLSLISNQALRRYVITGRPDLGMPAYNEKTQRAADFKALTSEEINDLVTLLAAWRTGNLPDRMAIEFPGPGTTAERKTAAVERTRIP